MSEKLYDISYLELPQKTRSYGRLVLMYIFLQTDLQ